MTCLDVELIPELNLELNHFLYATCESYQVTIGSYATTSTLVGLHSTLCGCEIDDVTWNVFLLIREVFAQSLGGEIASRRVRYSAIQMSFK